MTNDVYFYDFYNRKQTLIINYNHHLLVLLFITQCTNFVINITQNDFAVIIMTSAHSAENCDYEIGYLFLEHINVVNYDL